MTDVLIDARRGAGSSLEILYGTVTWKPTLTHSRGTSVVLPAPTTFDLVDGRVVATNVQPTPDPVEGQIEWAYEVTFKDRHGKTFSFLVGVPDSTTQVNFISLPRYFETKPPLFGQGPKGDPGESATVAVGTVAEGTEASITNSGTNTDAILDFVLPEGPQGPKGDGVFFVDKLFSDTPDSYGSGTTISNVNTVNGWPLNFAMAVTHKRFASRVVQELVSSDGKTFMRRYGGTTAWTEFKSVAYADLATTTANGLMSSGDKSKLDNVGEVAYNTKTLSSAPSTYPEGTSSGVMRSAAGWPEIAGATFALITTSKAPSPYNSAIQWASPHYASDSANKDTAPTLFRVGTSADTWGAWQTTATSEQVAEATAGVVKQVSSNVTYFVRLTGSDSNDGLSTSSAFRTINKAVQQTDGVTYASGAVVTIDVGAGTFAESVRFTTLSTTLRTIHVKGVSAGHPNVPTTLLKISESSTSTGIVVRDPLIDLTVEDIKFYGFDGNASSAGVAHIGGSRVTLVNVHAEKCFWGVTSQASSLVVKGGIYTNCGRTDSSSNAGAAIRSLMVNMHSIGEQYAGDNSRGPIFRDNYMGVLAQESSVGHVDYCTFENNDTAVYAKVNSRMNAGGSQFNNNTVAVAATGNSFILASANRCVGNRTNFMTGTGGVITLSTYTAYINGTDNSLAPSPRRNFNSYTEIRKSGGNEYVYERTLSKDFWDDINPSRPKKVTVSVRGEVLGAGNGTKSLALRLADTSDGAVADFSIATSESGAFKAEIEIVFISRLNQLITGTMSINGAPVKTVTSKVAVDMSIDKLLRLSARTTSALDTVVINAIEGYLEG